MRSSLKRHDGGFTLVELMTVVAIIGILVTVAVASFTVSIERSRRMACVANQRMLDSALMQYQVDHHDWPPDLDAVKAYLKWPGPDFATCASNSHVHLVYDLSTGGVSCPNHPR